MITDVLKEKIPTDWKNDLGMVTLKIHDLLKPHCKDAKPYKAVGGTTRYRCEHNLINELYQGIVPEGWTSVYDRNPDRTGMYQVLAVEGSVHPSIKTWRWRFTATTDGGRWAKMDWVKILAWKSEDNQE